MWKYLTLCLVLMPAFCLSYDFGSAVTPTVEENSVNLRIKNTPDGAHGTFTVETRHGNFVVKHHYRVSDKRLEEDPEGHADDYEAFDWPEGWCLNSDYKTRINEYERGNISFIRCEVS